MCCLVRTAGRGMTRPISSISVASGLYRLFASRSDSGVGKSSVSAAAAAADDEAASATLHGKN